MELQKVFNRAYAEKLRNDIEIPNYLKEEFPFDKTQVRMLANVYKPDLE